jgi:hypothetical protein
MATITPLRRKTTRGPRKRYGGLARTPATQPDIEELRESVKEYILAMSAELAELSYKNGYDALAVLFDMAREIVEHEESSSDRHLQQS